MQYLKSQLNNGSITIVNLVTWGIALASFAGTITYAAYASNQTDIVELKVNDATMAQQIANIERNTNLLVDTLIKK